MRKEHISRGLKLFILKANTVPCAPNSPAKSYKTHSVNLFSVWYVGSLLSKPRVAPGLHLTPSIKAITLQIYFAIVHLAEKRCSTIFSPSQNSQDSSPFHLCGLLDCSLLYGILHHKPRKDLNFLRQLGLPNTLEFLLLLLAT